MPATPPDVSTLRCAACGLEHASEPIPLGCVARCSRCDSEIERHPQLGLDFVASVSIASLICWFLALAYPLATARLLGRESAVTLLSLGRAFRADGQLALGITADLVVVLLPTALLALLVYLAFALQHGSSPSALSLPVRLCCFAKRWAMPEVMLLSVLIAFIKLDELAETAIGPGAWFLATAVALLTIVLQVFPLETFRPARPASARPDHRATWAWLAAAAFMLVPANLLPMMQVRLPGQVTSDTLIGGIGRLATSGMWAIAAIVFIASMLVPFIKLAGLAWLILLARSQGGGPRTTKLYRFLDFIGRWSMLDILLIGFLAALIQFDNLARVTAGPAAPAFAAAVILTVIAVESFDTRSLWPRPAPASL